MKTGAEIKNDAKKLIEGKWAGLFLNSLLISFAFAAIAIVIGLVCGICGIETKITETVTLFGIKFTITKSTFVGSVISFLTSMLGILGSVGILYYLINFVRGKEIELMDAIKYVINHIVSILLISLLSTILISVGFLVLIIPGFIVSLGLSFVFLVYFDNPELGVIDTIKKTWNMMNGHKLDYFLFTLSFIGWMLLCVVIIPAVYVFPYLMVAEILFYEEVKKLS